MPDFVGADDSVRPFFMFSYAPINEEFCRAGPVWPATINRCTPCPVRRGGRLCPPKASPVQGEVAQSAGGVVRQLRPLSRASPDSSPWAGEPFLLFCVDWRRGTWAPPYRGVARRGAGGQGRPPLRTTCGFVPGRCGHRPLRVFYRKTGVGDAAPYTRKNRKPCRAGPAWPAAILRRNSCSAPVGDDAHIVPPRHDITIIL